MKLLGVEFGISLMLLDSIMLSRMSPPSPGAADDTGTGVGTNENRLFRLELGSTLGPDVVVTASSVWVSLAIFLSKLFLLLNLFLIENREALSSLTPSLLSSLPLSVTTLSS